MLSLKGDTKGQRDQIVNELMRVHTRMQARVNEYRILLNMAVKFYEDLSKVTMESNDSSTNVNRFKLFMAYCVEDSLIIDLFQC
jgi:hypothetical protein